MDCWPIAAWTELAPYLSFPRSTQQHTCCAFHTLAWTGLVLGRSAVALVESSLPPTLTAIAACIKSTSSCGAPKRSYGIEDLGATTEIHDEYQIDIRCDIFLGVSLNDVVVSSFQRYTPPNRDKRRPQPRVVVDAVVVADSEQTLVTPVKNRIHQPLVVATSHLLQPETPIRTNAHILGTKVDDYEYTPHKAPWKSGREVQRTCISPTTLRRRTQVPEPYSLGIDHSRRACTPRWGRRRE